MKLYCWTFFTLVLWLKSCQAGEQMIFHHTKCEREFKKVGCFKNQPFFKDVLMKTNETHTDWNQFGDHLHNMACLCYQKAHAGYYKYFAIGKYSFCYGGNDIDAFNKMKSNSAAISNKCLSGNYYESCDNNGKNECSGGMEDVYVYSFKPSEPAQNTPVNGVYSDWTDWSTCDKTCGTGTQIRERVCTNPSPSNNGKDCSELGPSTESQKCSTRECPLHWLKRENFLYHFSSLKKTWSEAEEYCEKHGGHLASIHNGAENDFLITEANKRGFTTSYVGLTDANKEKTWVWIDGTKVAYTDWLKGEPNNAGNEDCLVIYKRTGKSWNDIPCSGKNNFICKKNHFEKKTYFLSTSKKTFDQAEARCAEMNGHLASIHSAAENAYLDKEAAARNLENPWIGFEDRVKEGDFVWVDGTSVVYKAWAPHEPNNLPSEHCAHIRHSSKAVWNDRKCSTLSNFICKMNEPFTISVTEKLLNKHENAVYYFSDKKKTWAQAESNCIQLGGHLASIHTKDEQNYLTDELKNRNFEHVWIGGNDVKKEGSWVWSDLTQFDYKVWKAKEPNNLGNEDCLEYQTKSKQWNDLSCGQIHHFACKVINFQGNNYYISHDKKNFADAEKHCISMNGHLASIHSKLENQFLTQELVKRKIMYPWIGLEDRTKEGAWKWTDGSSVTYTEWYKGEPNNVGNEDCTHMRFHTLGQWNDSKCANRYHYICKF